MTKPMQGQTVEVNDRAVFSGTGENWVQATVEEVLSVQFLAKLRNGRRIYRMFNAEGDTWRHKKSI